VVSTGGSGKKENASRESTSVKTFDVEMGDKRESGQIAHPVAVPEPKTDESQNDACEGSKSSD